MAKLLGRPQQQKSFWGAGVNLKGKRILARAFQPGWVWRLGVACCARRAGCRCRARLGQGQTATEQVRQDAETNVDSFELIELDLADLKERARLRRCTARKK